MPSSPEVRFAALAEALRDVAGVTAPGDSAGPRRKFGANALKVGGKIFAMLTGGRLVVKLPKQRIAALVETGSGEPLDQGNGRLMKEWLSLHPDASLAWLPLAEEALEFVRPKA